MDYSKALIIVFITLVIVIGLNAAIYYGITRKHSRNDSVGQIELLRRAAGRVRDPWEVENTNLSELSKLVKDLPGKPKVEQESLEHKAKDNG